MKVVLLLLLAACVPADERDSLRARALRADTLEGAVRMNIRAASLLYERATMAEGYISWLRHTQPACRVEGVR